MDMSVVADMLRELSRLCPICKVLFLKLLGCMKNIIKIKELNFTVLPLKYAPCRYVHEFLTDSSTTTCGFYFEVN